MRFAPGTVPDKTTYRWVSKFRQTGADLKRHSVYFPEKKNICRIFFVF
jgi:transposase